jgi:hypothetical protein
MTRLRWIGLVAIVAVGPLALGACSGGIGSGLGGSDGGGGGGAQGEVSRGAEPQSSGFSLDESAGNLEGQRAATTATRLPSLRPSIIKTAQIKLEVGRRELLEAIGDATGIAGRYGGFVLTSSVDSDRSSSGTLVLRVPADRFETALGDLEELGKVESKGVSGEDVGQQFVDLEARLQSWETQEDVLLRLMGRARTIGQTIRVQSELQQVQLEIERIRGRLRYLDDQTALSTITASFVASGVPPNSGPTMLEVAWERAVGLALGFVAALITALGLIVPAGILIGIGFIVFRQVRPRFTP